jgi:1,4-dihydroxy-2-naphthoyl-CoA hydrolase
VPLQSLTGREAAGEIAGLDAPGFSTRELATAPVLATPLEHVVRFQDTDAAGIVFFARVLEYFHDAYAVFLRAEGCPLEEAMERKRWAAPLKSSEAHFLRPMRFGDALSTALVRVRLSGSDLEMGYRTSVRGEAAAVGVLRAVFVDWATFKRAPPPEDVARVFRRIEAASAGPS